MKKLAKASIAALAVLLLVMLVAGCKPAAAKSVEMWSFTDELKSVITDFEAKFPGKKINLTITPTAEYVAKIQPVLAGGSGAPDVFTGEAAFFRLFIDSGFWDNLSAEPYKADALVKEKVTPYVVALSKDKGGILRALSWQSTAGAFIARRDIAKEVLGTDDPAEVSKYTSSWKGFWELAAKIKDKTNGTKFISSDVNSDLIRIVYAGRKAPWIKDNKLNLDAGVIAFFDEAKKARDAGYDAKYSTWSGEWSASMENGNVFGYVLPTWGLHYVLKPNAPAQKGNYMLVSPPSSYYWGGTWLGIYSKAKMANKMTAWDFVKMMCLDDEYMEGYAKKTGDFLSNVKVVEKIKGSFSDEFLNGQNHYAYFFEEAKKIDGSTMSEYDQTVEQAIGNRLNEYLNGTIATVNDAVAAIKADIKAGRHPCIATLCCPSTCMY